MLTSSLRPTVVPVAGVGEARIGWETERMVRKMVGAKVVKRMIAVFVLKCARRLCEKW